MENHNEGFEITDEFLEQMQKETIPPTQEEIDARQKIDDSDPLMDGDRDKGIHAREDNSNKQKE